MRERERERSVEDRIIGEDKTGREREIEREENKNDEREK